VAVHNVAAGVAGTDAVNVNQLNSGVANANAYTDARANALQNDIQAVRKDSVAYTDARANALQNIQAARRDASAGTAGAMAMANLPQARTPGKSMVAAGVAGYDGAAGLALGVSRLSDNGQWITKFAGTANSRGKVGVAASVGMEW
jgi:trimeric autotransporter adhesin